MHFDWKDYFIFTSKEQKGILVLGCILSISLFLHYVLPINLPNEHAYSNGLNKPKNLFYFDPNSIDTIKGIQLGLSLKQMNTLYHYRNKGGRFYKKEDLLKWYGLSESQARLLMPWVRILKQDSLYSSKNKPYGNWIKVGGTKIDINNAHAAEWVKVTGLPAYKVKRILTYQKWTGGFKSIQGLKKVYGITAFDFEMIYPYLKFQPNRSKKMAYQTMRFENWKSLGLFDDKTIWAILKFKKDQQGRLTWSEMVVQFDLTEVEATELKKRTNLAN